MYCFGYVAVIISFNNKIYNKITDSISKYVAVVYIKTYVHETQLHRDPCKGTVRLVFNNSRRCYRMFQIYSPYFQISK